MRIMQSDIDFASEQLDFDEGDTSLEPSPDLATDQTINLINEALVQLTSLSTALAEQTQENTQFIQDLGQGVLSQITIITDLHKQTSELKQNLESVTIQVKETSTQTSTLTESLDKIQELQKISIKNCKQLTTQTSSPGPVSTSFNRRSIFTLVTAQSVSVVLAIVFLLNQFPPKATAKAEQQWYSIFQRVDRLYKAKFGNTAPK